jgi:hypothetical protein
MLTVRSTLSKSVSNATQKFDGLMHKPQLRNLREMTLGMLLGESSHLSTIGASVSGEVTPRKNTERYARTLEKIDVDACTKQHIACAALRFQSEPVLLLGDGGDMQKPHANVMEEVCSCVDGSEGHSVGKGYPTFACVAYGLTSGKQLPLVHHLYSTKAESFKSQWDEQKKRYEWLTPFLRSSFDRIAVEDRGCDDEKRFLFFLNDLHCSFLTRINVGEKSRKLCPLREEEIQSAINVQQIARESSKSAGAKREWHNRKLNKDCTSKIAFREVRLPGHPGIPLFLVLLFTEEFKEPIVLLTDITVDSFEKAWEVFFWYKKRWEVENFFRAIKQEFGAEQFLIRSIAAIKALAFVQMLAFCLLRDIREKATELFGLLFSLFQEFCRKWQRSKESHLDLLQWIREMWRSSTTSSVSHRVWSRHMYDCLCTKPRNQLALFSCRGKW